MPNAPEGDASVPTVRVSLIESVCPLPHQSVIGNVMVGPGGAQGELAAGSIRKAQQRYKRGYDRRTTPTDYRVGDWILVKCPQEETGKLRKPSRPWHRPYRVVSKRDPDVTAVKVYSPQDGQIQVQQSRVTTCPSGFPAGYFWYGPKRHSPGRPPRWIHKLLSNECPNTATDEFQNTVPERTQCRRTGSYRHKLCKWIRQRSRKRE